MLDLGLCKRFSGDTSRRNNVVTSEAPPILSGSLFKDLTLLPFEGGITHGYGVPSGTLFLTH